MKRALALLGDAWHAPHILRRVMAEKLEKLGAAATILTDYTTPSNYTVDFQNLGAQYDLLIIGRYGLNDYRSFQGENTGRVYWLSDRQLEEIERFVTEGGSLLLHHGAIGFYPEESRMCQLARAFCLNHPPIIPIHVEPVGQEDQLNQGVVPFDTADEEFNVTLDMDRTTVYLQSYSQQNGLHPQAWFHSYGKGRVAVFVPGHDSTVLRHPMVEQGLENTIRCLLMDHER